MRARVRYRVRSREGEELVVPSLADLVALYEGGFLSDDDLVKQESASTWERAGNMGALHGARERRQGPRRTVLLLVALVGFAIALGILLAT